MPYRIPFLGKAHQHVNVIALRLDRRKAVFGEVIRGIEVIDKIVAAVQCTAPLTFRAACFSLLTIHSAENSASSRICGQGEV